MIDCIFIVYCKFGPGCAGQVQAAADLPCRCRAVFAVFAVLILFALLYFCNLIWYLLYLIWCRLPYIADDCRIADIYLYWFGIVLIIYCCRYLLQIYLIWIWYLFIWICSIADLPIYLFYPYRNHHPTNRPPIPYPTIPLNCNLNLFDLFDFDYWIYLYLIWIGTRVWSSSSDRVVPSDQLYLYFAVFWFVAVAVAAVAVFADLIWFCHLFYCRSR